LDQLIPLFDSTVSDQAIARVTDTLRAGWLSEGAGVKAFEQRFAEAFGLPHAAAVNSGTAALHLAMLGCGAGPGDEVITTALSFVATPLAAMYTGARPVFADLEPNSPNLDPADVERRITPRTRAVIVVHYGGLPCDMEAFEALADRHGLSLVEDAAHAVGARRHGRPAGSFGRYAAFSFQAIKLLTTGDGGMLVSRDAEDHARAMRQRWFGIDRAGRTPSPHGEADFDITELGFKMHMNDIAAAMGLAHLEGAAAELERRRELNARYRDALADVAGLTLPAEPSDAESACWLFTVLVERRADFVRALRDRGVHAGAWHRRLDRYSLLGGLRDDLPHLAAFDDRQAAIPLRASLSEEEVDQVLDAVRAGW
jgi:perosamine synthetase